MRPNIVYIMADDLGYGDLGCYGAEKIRTPNIDSISKAGMIYTDIHSSSALCTPSRYSVLTGRYAWRTWLKRFVLGGFGSPLIEKERLTVASILKNKGYYTAAVGKWHVGLNWFKKDGMPLSVSNYDGWNTNGFEVDYKHPIEGGARDLGFDYWFGMAGSLDMPPYCFLENYGPVEVPSMEKAFYGPQQRRGLMQPDWRDDQVDITFARKAVEIIDEHSKTKKDKPLFLYLTPSAPHRPCIPADFMRGKSDAGVRGDMVMLFDWVVGEVVNALKKNGMLKNTLLIITSDNGAIATNFNGKDYGHKANGDLRGQKGDIFDGGHREPFIAMWEGVIKPGTRSDELLGLIDFTATCADIVDFKLPDNAAEDSRSFLSILKGEKSDEPIHDAVIHHSLDGMFAVRRGEWKLIMGLGSGGFSYPRRYTMDSRDFPGQLYNINDDFRETLNRWQGRPDIVDEFSEILRRYQRKDDMS
ncbi:MAG: arylsulfatase [Spirochaetes bacterium]|nr:arylsulfatase [Spirochaetota bacterium]